MSRRTRQQLDEEVQCPRCTGTGRAEKWGYVSTCSFCGGSGLKKEPKMRAECECGARQPRWTSAYSAQKWMQQHLNSHAPETFNPEA